MKLLGLIGGVSPESTAIYYRLLNECARARAGAKHSARLILWSFDYDVMEKAYFAANWPAYRELVADAGLALKRAGVDGLMICSNTTNLAAAALAERTGLPVIYIVEALAAALSARGSRRPLLLGTRFVMEGDFYRDDLQRRLGSDAVVPDAEDRVEVSRIIFEELVNGRVEPASRRRLLTIAGKAKEDGVDGLILGCTELSMILSQADTDLPVFDTTQIHVDAALDFAFGERG